MERLKELHLKSTCVRIVSLAPSNTEILFEIGAGKDIVATTSLCNHPEEAVELPSVGGWSDGLDVEKVVEIDPEFAIASDDLQDDVVERLERQGVDVLQVKPHSLEEVFTSIERIGRVVEREQEARKLVENMKEKLEEVSISGRIYCEEWSQPPMVSGNWIPGLVEAIGGEYFIGGGRSRGFELEELERFDPEFIFLNVCGAGEGIDTGEVVGREGWQGITAVSQRNIHVLNDALLNRPGPRLVEGAKEIAHVVESE